MLLFFAASVTMVKAQVLITPQIPPYGVAQKIQLWNMVLTNTSNAVKSIHLEMMITDARNGQQVMSGASRILDIAPGIMQANAAILGPIQYNILSSSYYVDPGPAGLLPVGDFDVCFSILLHVSDAVNKIGEECQELIIEPLSPPLLQSPYETAVIETRNPMFTWLPPMPVNLFTNLRYDLELVELYPNQSAADGMQQNIPIFRQSGIPTTSLFYPVSAVQLSMEKMYAWRILAKSNEAIVAQSETWTFSLKDFAKSTLLLAQELPYVKLKKEDAGGFAVFPGVLKFDYTNETSDTTWNITLTDLSEREPRTDSLDMDSIPLRPGQNLVNYRQMEKLQLIDRHFYLLEVTNLRQEKWRLRFEYRKPD